MTAMLLIAMTVGWMGLAAGSDSAALNDLLPGTVDAYLAYLQSVEAEGDGRMRGERPFLWTDESAGRRERVRRGGIVIEQGAGGTPRAVPDGLVHDWIGAVFVQNATLDQVLAMLQDYDNHTRVYGPEVIDSKLVSRDGPHFVVFLKLKKKRVLTAVLNTVHDARYTPLGPTRWYSRSSSTRIAEVRNPGAADEQELPPGTGHGFLWRLDSFWRFEQRDGGVYIECQSVSLTRGIPWGLGWLIEPIVTDLPKESLTNTLAATRAAVAGRNR
jgi:hypothetical protein